MTQKQIIIRHLQTKNDWTPAYKLRGVATVFGFIGHQGDRRCRELCENGKLEHKIEGGYAWYRVKSLSYKPYKVLLPDGSVDKIINLPIK